MTVPSNVAFNPITWLVGPQGWDHDRMPPIDQVFATLRNAGFSAVHAEVPANGDEKSYRKALELSGLSPAPGYFQGRFDDHEALNATRGAALRAAEFHASLGLDRIFIAELANVDPARSAHPGTGAGFDQSRLARIAENLDHVAEAMANLGVSPCLHPHVGSFIETEEEIEFVLANTGGALLFGPDTGHLAWAGMDPDVVIQRHVSRVGAVHLKDLHGSAAQAGLRSGASYDEIANLNHLWTEPGRGDVDFDRVFAALSSFSGWYVIEVDKADLPSVEETVEVSARWATAMRGRFNG